MGYAKPDGRVELRGLELLAKLAARCAVERRLHIVVEARIGDVKAGQRHTGYSGEAATNEARQHVPILVGKFLEDDQAGAQRVRMFHDRSGQALSCGGAGCIISFIKVGFASRTSNHYGFHKHKSWPAAPDCIYETSDLRMSSGKDIQIKNEKWLDCLNVTVTVPDGKIPIIEFRMDGILDDFVIAAVLVVRPRGALPMPAISLLKARNDAHPALLACRCRPDEQVRVRHGHGAIIANVALR